MKAVTSRANPAVKALGKLIASTVERKRAGLSVIEGTHLVGAFLDSGRAPDTVVVSKSGLAHAEVARLVERVEESRVTAVTDSIYESLSTVESPVGIMASVVTPTGEGVPADAAFCLLLEDIQDPGNVGTLIRSAAAAGVGHVLLSPTCAFAWSPKVLRSGQGAHFALNIVEGADLAAFVKSYKGASVALAAHGSNVLHAIDLTGPVAILVGNEGAGLSEVLLDEATARAAIPMPGRIESLNAGVAGSIALFEVVRQRGARTPSSSNAPR